MERSSAYDRLLQQVCIGLGYCGSVIDGEPSHVDMFIPEEGPVTADEFVEWVFRAEGLEAAGGEHSRQIREAFVQHMGGEVVEARLLK